MRSRTQIYMYTERYGVKFPPLKLLRIRDLHVDDAAVAGSGKIRFYTFIRWPTLLRPLFKKQIRSLIHPEVASSPWDHTTHTFYTTCVRHMWLRVQTDCRENRIVCVPLSRLNWG